MRNGIPRTFLKDLHGFRGFAILNIVTAHIFVVYFSNLRMVAPLDPASAILNVASKIIWHDSTIYFALISGLLFSRFVVTLNWTKFFGRKLTNVFLPYAVVTLISSLIWYEAGPSGRGLVGMFEGLSPFINRFLSNLINGTATITYWYMPVLACLFLATPLLYSLAKKNPVLLAFFVLLPLIVSRVGNDVCLQTVIYFAGSYAIGLYAGIDYELTLSSMHKNFRVLVGVAIATSAVLALLFDRRWNFLGAVSMRESVFYIQKLSLSACVLVCMDAWKDKLPRSLNHVATYAFAIYFVHLFFVVVFVEVAITMLPPPLSAIQIFFMAISMLVIVLIASLIIAMGSRIIFGRRARMILGA